MVTKRKTTRKRSTRKRSTRKRSTRKRSTGTTKDLEAKIAQLEGKLSQLSAQAGQKPAEAKAPPPPPPKPSAEKPAEPPKPAPQAEAPPRTLESVIESVPAGNWIMQKTKTPAYVCENPRSWARRHPDVDVGPVPTTSWTLQKSKITGYTAPSNQYFANKQRLAYKNPASSFTGYGVSLGYGGTKTVPPPPKPQTHGSLPKGS